MTVWCVEIWKTSDTPALVLRRYTEQPTMTYVVDHDPGAGTHTYAVKAYTMPSDGSVTGITGAIGDRNLHISVHKR